MFAATPLACRQPRAPHSGLESLGACRKLTEILKARSAYTRDRNRPPWSRLKAIALCSFILTMVFGSARAAGPGAGLTAPGSSGVIREARTLLDLPPNDLKIGPPVEIRGVVTLADTDFDLWFVHDGTASVYVHPAPSLRPWERGQLVVVKGVARQGRFAPYVDEPRVSLLGQAPLPEPQPASEADLIGGRLDAQWVQVAGVVRSAEIQSGRLMLDTVSGATRFKAWVQHFETNLVTALVGKRLRLRGVLAAKTAPAGELSGCQLFLDSAADIKMAEPVLTDAPPAEPLLAKDLGSYRLRHHVGERVNVHGFVACQWSHTAFLLSDPTGLVEIQCATNFTFAPGDLVEVAGFLSFRPCSPRIEDAFVAKVGQTNLPPPQRLEAGTSWQPRYQNQRVKLEAVLLARTRPQPDLAVLLLQSGAGVWRASLWSTSPSSELDAFEPGSQLRLTGLCRLAAVKPTGAGFESACPWCDGACRVGSDPRSGEVMANLWLNAPTDVERLKGPASTWSGWGMVSGGISLLAGALVFVARHRRLQAERLMGEQMALQAEIRDHERYLRRSLEERERLGRELHDDIIQSIYAVGLGLEDTRRQWPALPNQVRDRLSVAIESLNQVIHTVRNFIGGLEPKIIDGREFKTALKSLALTLGPGHAQFAIDSDAAAAESLTSAQTMELLRIAKEAMSNSLRHAQASRIAVSLHPEERGVCLEISDNGIGFDPRKVATPGQGLRNIAARAATLGARLEILSSPDKGCRIVLHIAKSE